jgi:membrane protease YdiL (CAAX protease family)
MRLDVFRTSAALSGVAASAVVYTLVQDRLASASAATGMQTLWHALALMVAVGVLARVARRMGLTRAQVGLDLRGWRGCRGSLLDAFLWSVLVGMLLTLVRLVLLQTSPACQDLALLAPWRSAHGLAWTLGINAVYLLFAWVQEWLVRGLLHGVLEVAMRTGPDRPSSAIGPALVANAVFAGLHVHLGLAYVAQAAWAGAFWAWLRHRHGHVLGAGLSHALIGLWTTGVMDLPGVWKCWP